MPPLLMEGRIYNCPCPSARPSKNFVTKVVKWRHLCPMDSFLSLFIKALRLSLNLEMSLPLMHTVLCTHLNKMAGALFKLNGIVSLKSSFSVKMCFIESFLKLIYVRKK